MASRRRISYQWRLFFPIMGLMALVIGSIFGYHLYMERELRTDLVHDQLSTINGRILEAYEQNIDLNNYLKFLEQFYDNSIFDELRVSVYNVDGNVIYTLGEMIPADIQLSDYEEDSGRPGQTGKSHLNADDPAEDHHLFYLSQVKSDDGMITVYTAMPLTMTISDAINLNSGIWYLIAGLIIIVTLVTYYSTRFLSRNILIMRDFARRASSGEPIDPNYDFPHDELGDISREIVSLYTDKARAVLRIDHEHAVALNAINEKARIKRQLTNNINHELKTPIGVISGYIDTILGDPDMDAEMRTHFLQRAQSNIDRLRSLMEDVSTMTRLEEGGGSIPLTEVDLHDILFHIDSDFEASQIAPGMKFTYDIPLGCKVQANEGFLQGLIMNLIKNSGIHSHGKNINFSLISESSRFYTFAFYDDGEGVPEESLPHLFERFYRVDKGRSRKVGGTGLGLPIVKNSINSMGGTISVHNRSKGGLEFVFTLVKWDARDRVKRPAPHPEETGSDRADNHNLETAGIQ